MSGTAFAPRSRLHLALRLAGLVAALLPAPLRAGPVQLPPTPASAPATRRPPPTTLAPLTPEQQQKLKERNRLRNEANQLQRQGKLAEAIATAEKMLAIERQVFGDIHNEVAESLEWLAALHQQREDFAAAAQARRELLALRIQLHGPEHWKSTDARLALADVERLAVLTATQRQRLAEAERLNGELIALYRRGQARAAVERARQALAIRKEVLGPKHPDYAASLNNLAALYRSLGDYARAEPLYRLALKIKKQTLGQQHPDYATSLNNLALLCHETGDYAQAETLYQQALQIRREALGPKHPVYATSLDNLAALYKEMGDYVRAGPLHREALRIRKQTLGEHHPDYATSLNNLALLYERIGDYAQAEPLLRQALQIKKQRLGEKHPAYATSLNNLGLLYKQMGDYARAEPLYLQALQIRKEALGEHHPAYAISLSNLARLYDSSGDAARAEPLLRQVLQIRKEALGPKHPDYAASLNNLAVHYDSRGDHARAEPLLRQALAIRRQVLGAKHPDYAASLNNLAALYVHKGDYARVEPLYREALEIKRQTLGTQHPDYAITLSNLALLYWSEAAALQLLLPPATPLYHLSACAAAIDATGAELLLRQAGSVAQAGLELAATAQSQRQQLEMLTDFRCRLDTYLSVIPLTQCDVARQYQAVLSWKGAVGRRQRLQRLARQQPELAADFTALDRLCARLAALSLATPDPARLHKRHQLIHDLTEQKERLEAELARKSISFRTEQELQHLQPAQLQALLPADAVLLDFLYYGHISPIPWKKGGLECQRRLAAFVLRRGGLARVDLGQARDVSKAVERWRLALQRRFRTEGDAQLGAAVYKLLWQPLESHLQGARLVLIAPDHVLARVPFAALPGRRKDSYLLEELSLAVVPVPQLVPQLLAPRRANRASQPSLLLVGDVRYDGSAGAAGGSDSHTAPRHGTDARFHWPALADTRAEVSAIADTFHQCWGEGTVTQLRGAKATEAALRQQAPTHRFVHLATHGYFAPKELRSALALASHSQEKDTANLFQRQDVAGFHPGLLSGLVLAGANQPVDAEKDDGILTALEVEALDLSGVELATLSACETGLGEAAGGEGLLGLQRAFQTAGARSVVAGLWQVDDAATRKLMTQFYTNLWTKKLSKLEALRQAQLWMLREGDAWMQKEGISRGMVDVRVPKDRLPIEDGRLAPYYWAAFSLSGDWR